MSLLPASQTGSDEDMEGEDGGDAPALAAVGAASAGSPAATVSNALSRRSAADPVPVRSHTDALPRTRGSSQRTSENPDSFTMQGAHPRTTIATNTPPALWPHNVLWCCACRPTSCCQ